MGLSGRKTLPAELPASWSARGTRSTHAMVIGPTNPSREYRDGNNSTERSYQVSKTYHRHSKHAGCKGILPREQARAARANQKFATFVRASETNAGASSRLGHASAYKRAKRILER